MTRTDNETVERYLQAKEQVISCLKMIKRCESKEEMEDKVLPHLADACPHVTFEQQTADKLAELHLKLRQV